MNREFFVDDNIALAKTIDKSFYTDPGIFEMAKERIFSSSWQFVGSSDLVKLPGDAFPVTLLKNYLDEPILLMRDNDNQIRLLSNVCTHRGNIIVDAPCRLTKLRCRYHGRLFQLDGQFVAMPEFKEVVGFPTATDNLHSLPIHSWGKWLFTSLNSSRPVSAFLDDMKSRLAWLPSHDFVFKPEFSREFTVNAHWALYCENYLEGFHIPFVHSGLNSVIDFGNYTTELYGFSNLQLGIAKSEDDCFDLPPESPDFGKSIAAYYFFIFPNMMFNFYPWGLSLNVVQPISPQESKISFSTYIWKEDKFNTGAGSELDTVELEDEEVVNSVQLGIKSRFYNHGRYSVSREQGTHHFHRIIAEWLQ